MKTLNRFSGFPQAMIIAFTSDMIPRLVYYWSFSVYPYHDHFNNTMEGYINSSLSIFNTSDFSSRSKPIMDNGTTITTCRCSIVLYTTFYVSLSSLTDKFKTLEVWMSVLWSKCYSVGIEISATLQDIPDSMSTTSTTGTWWQQKWLSSLLWRLVQKRKQENLPAPRRVNPNYVEF